MTTTSERAEKWKALSTGSSAKTGGIIPFGLEPGVDDDAVVSVDEDWMASMRPDYVDPTEDLTEDDIKQLGK